MFKSSLTPESDVFATADTIICCECELEDHFEYTGDLDEPMCQSCGHMLCDACSSDRGPEYSKSSSDRQLESSNAAPHLPIDVEGKISDQNVRKSRNPPRLIEKISMTSFFASSSSDGTDYATELAREVTNRMNAYELDDQTVDRLSKNFPALLEALTFDLRSRLPDHYRVIRFTYEQRGAIFASFKKICQQLRETALRSGGFGDSGIIDNLPDEIEDSDLSKMEEIKRAIFTSRRFNWIIDRLIQGEMKFSNQELHILNAIRDPIRSAFSSSSPLAYQSSLKIADVTYTLDWDILAFLRAQKYELCDADAVINAITLTGSAIDAQALSCRNYMAQVWPYTGYQTLEVLQHMLRTNEKYQESFACPSRFKISTSIVGSSVSIRVSTADTELLVEIGEQLAWLGAALRSPPGHSGVVHCVPRISRTESSGDGRQEMEFAVEYSYEYYKSENNETNGRCWHNLFANPTIVRGYPIPKRCETGIGMESSLEMLVALAGSRYVDTFKSMVFIKGFSTMLIPTRRLENILIWHLLQSDNPNERISYLDCDLEHADIEIEDLKRYRHVLGWCSDAISIAGTKLANYDIDKSRLLHAHSGCALEKVEISGGQFVTSTAVFSLGNRERPVHIIRSGFPIKLQWISSKYFVLWDEEEKRGWLVNGASVLLHILRSSLRYSQQKLRSVWSLDPNALEDVAGEPRSNSALEVLINEKNRDLKLFIDRTEVYDEETQGQHNSIVSTRSVRHYRLEDRIEHIYNILEKLIDHQTDVERRSGLDIKIRPRRQLEGWDFKDLAADGDPFFPRVAHLQTVGKGWVDFTRALHAVTLFGRGFGELIQPQFGKGKVKPCPLWSTVPSNKYYLTAFILDLQDIMERDGDPNSNPRRLCEKVIWYMKQATFDLCPCNQGQKHHDPVQVLFPRHFMKNIKKKPQIDLESQGAVIFGHNINLHWHWRDHGDPVKGDPQDQVNTPDTSNSSGPESSPTSSIDNNSTSVTAAGSSGPMQTPESPPSDPCGATPNTQKRRFQDVLSSNLKRARISLPKR